MTEIIQKINESGLSPNQYFLLYALINKLELKTVDIEQETAILESLGHVDEGVITSSLFDKEMEEKGFKSRVTTYMRIFPCKYLPSGAHARGKDSPVITKLKAFMRAYPYDWDLIYRATEAYVERYKKTGYLYMQNASSFVFDKNGDSTLALECDTILEYNKENEDDFAI